MGINIYYTDSFDEVYNGIKQNARIEDEVIDFLWINKDMFIHNFRYFDILEPYKYVLLSLSQIRGLIIFANDTLKVLSIADFDSFKECNTLDKVELFKCLRDIKYISEKALQNKMKLVSLGD